MENMEQKGYVPIKFIVFLKTTLGKMVAANILGTDILDLHFWQQWPKKFYNVRQYDSTKTDLVKNRQKAIQSNDMEKGEYVDDANTVSEDLPPTQLPDAEELPDINDSPSILTSMVNKKNTYLYLFTILKPKNPSFFIY